MKHKFILSGGASFYISCNISFNERRHSVNVPGATGTTKPKGRSGVSSRLKLKAMGSRNRPGDCMASPDWYGQGWIACGAVVRISIFYSVERQSGNGAWVNRLT